MFREKEFGVDLEAKVSDMWTPRDDNVLKIKKPYTLEVNVSTLLKSPKFSWVGF